MSDKIYVADKSTLDSVNEKVSAILAIEKDEDVYGFVEHMDILDPDERIEYIGLNKNFNPITITMGGGYSLGDWATFPLLVNNKPYMVKSSGIVDYQLSETNYAKKADGETASDVANTSYDGGAFSWLQKIYKKEYIVGSDRYVKFSLEPREGYEAAGFIDTDNAELEGVWIPMFYGHLPSGSNQKLLTVSGTQPVYGKTTAEEKAAIDLFSARARFFGGAIINTIHDLLLLWGKTTNIQDKYGYGNCNGYDSTLSPTYGVLANAVVGGGQFYGTGSDDKTHLNKILHSIVLGSYQQWQRDPYTQCVSGKVYVSKNYKYDISTPGSTYTKTGVELATTSAWEYPNKYAVVEGFGKIPVQPCEGSTALGSCDGLYVNAAITAVGLRFGYCYDDLNDGVGALSLNSAAPYTGWGIGASVLLLPPAGATPYEVAA